MKFGKCHGIVPRFNGVCMTRREDGRVSEQHEITWMFACNKVLSFFRSSGLCFPIFMRLA